MKSVEIVITKKFVYTIDNLQNNEAWDIVNRQDDTITWAEELERDSEPVEIETTWVEANYIGEQNEFSSMADASKSFSYRRRF